MSPVKQAYTKLVNFYLRRAKRTKSKDVDTFWGEKMKILLPGCHATLLYRYGFVEESLITYMLRYLRLNDTFIDIGAHYGFFTLLASEIVGPEGKVYCFEPTPSTFKVLTENIKGRNNVVSNNCLIWSKEKEVIFRDYGPIWSEINSVFEPRATPSDRKILKYTEHRMKALSLDDYLKQNNISPKFVKIDAESAELEILHGMEETISAFKPIIALEVGDLNLDNVPASNKLVSFLTSRGYQTYEYLNDNIKNHSVKETYDYQILLFIKQ
jgi:FkbM family methyltransferase